ncbi:MAG: hypothetical protein KKC20_03770 [Proteobacteria bacterium]|nr:hypothetical protein [Pseudomonadota bacterium]
MEKNDFEARIGKAFTVTHSDGESVELKLLAVEPGVPVQGIPDTRQEPFSLVFLGPEDCHLPDNSYHFSSDDGFDNALIFISAFKSETGKGIYYDSVFT